METILIIGLVCAACALATILAALAGIVMVEMLSEHAAAFRRWRRSFKPRRRLPTASGPLLAA